MANVEPADAFPVPNATLDPAADACWSLAARIGEISSDDYQRSFTSVLIALLHAANPTSRWFLRYCTAAGVDLDAIYASRNFRPSMLRDGLADTAAAPLPSHKGAWTSSAQQIASAAASLAALTGSTAISVRHLLAAYFYHLPAAHSDQMAKWRFEPPRAASALLRHVRQLSPMEVEKLVDLHLRTFGRPPDLEEPDPLPPPRISGFAPDSPEGEDRLGIEDDVYALSALICSTRVSPPLSIGLFGDWGSGKSFFIRQMKRGVQWISEQARSSGHLQKDLPFYKHVVQIEFNAWNYSGGNLWASLVQHILENLRLSDAEPDDLVAERQKKLQEQMQLEQQARDRAARKADEAQRKVNETEAELRVLRVRHEQRIEALKKAISQDVLATFQLDAGSVETLNRLRKELKLPEASANAGAFLAAIDGTRAALQRASAIFEYVPTQHRTGFLFASAAVVAGPPLVAILVGLVAGLVQPYVASTAALTAWLSTTLGGAAAWVRGRTAVLNEQLAKVEELQAHARGRVQAEEQKHKADVARLEHEIVLGKDEIMAAQSAQAEAQARLEQLNAQLAATTPASVLADFVQERSQSDDYRKHLGLPAIIRRDFDRISRMIASDNLALGGKTSLEEEETDSRYRMNRIVLYIDDLDRCPEELVVEVLKAVHLLLAFQLFVVVVAVDARWVSRSLSKRFPGLLTPEAPGNGGSSREHAKPTDYLEKIFQIPFWLKPPTEHHVRGMVRGLLAEGAAAPVRAAAHERSGPHNVEQPSAPRVFKKREHDPNASMLDVSPDELQYIERLAPLLDRSPRALKRFVNVYRLLKASLPPEEQDQFLDESDGHAPFKTVALLLAIVNGLPSASRAMFGRKLDEQPVTYGTLTTMHQDDGEQAIDEGLRLSRWFEAEYGGMWSAQDASELRMWLPRVARYSYHLPR